MLTHTRSGRPIIYFQTLLRSIELDGRASRTEYWSFMGINTLVFIALGIIGNALHLPINRGIASVGGLYSLLVAVPSFSVGFRRMHDRGSHGIWSLVPVLGFVMALKPGDIGDNKYGVDPQEEE